MEFKAEQERAQRIAEARVEAIEDQLGEFSAIKGEQEFSPQEIAAREFELSGQIGLPFFEHEGKFPELPGPGLFEVKDEGPAKQIIEEVLERLDENPLLFETPEFNRQKVQDFVESHFDEQIGLVGSPEEFERDYKRLLLTGLSQADVSGNPLNVERTLNTIARGLYEAAEEGELLEEDAGTVVRATNLVLEPLLDQPFPGDPLLGVNAQELVDEVFAGELAQLRERELSGPELKEVRAQLNRDLLDQPRGIAELETLEGWVARNVRNPLLKRTLIGDIGEKLRQLVVRREFETGEEFTRTAERPGVIVQPISATQAIVVQRPFLADFSTLIGQQVSVWDDELKTVNPRAGIVQRNARSLIDGLNALLVQTQFKTEDGEQLRLSKQGSAVDLVEDLVKFQNFITGVPVNTFTFIPRNAEGKLQDTQQILGEIRDIVNAKPASQTRSMMPHPMQVREFGAIEIRKDSNGTREIIIQPHASLEQVMKLALTLSMEPGTLTDHTEEEVLKIGPRTSVGEIVSYLKVLLENSAGHIIRVKYTTPGLGEWVDGFMAPVIHGGALIPVPTSFEAHTATRQKSLLRSMPLSAYTRYGGAGPVSGIAGTVGSIAGTIEKILPVAKVITAPVKAVASVVKSIGSLFGF